MQYLSSWRRWTWEEIYSALRRERAVGEPFEVDHMLAPDPVRCGAELGGLDAAWHYRFLSSDGEHLCIQDRGDRYLAWLEAEECVLGDGVNNEEYYEFTSSSRQMPASTHAMHPGMSVYASSPDARREDVFFERAGRAQLPGPESEALLLGVASVALLVLPGGLFALLEGIVLPLLG